MKEMGSYTVLLSNFHRHGGGQRVYVRMLAGHMFRQDHRPIVACPRGSQLADECAKDGIEVRDGFDFGTGFTPISFFRDVALAKNVIIGEGVDLIHVNGPRDHWAMATANLLSKKKVPLVRTRHNTKPVRNNFLNRLQNQRLTNQTISPCQYVKDMYADSSVFKNCPIAVIHQGVELQEFSPTAPNENVRRELGVSEDDLVIGIVGRLDWDKGHKYLFEAVAPLIHGEFPNLKVVAVGFGKEHKNLRALCEKLNIAGSVIFLGQRTDVQEVISVFDLAAHPSIGVDTSSYAMKEMMAMEKPIVSSSYGGLKEIAEDGVTGYVIPPRNSNVLRYRIAELCRSRDLRERMGKAARKKVEREFTATVSVEKTLQVYEQTIENFGKRREGRR
jgi:glycosyltransferase involved in cell wall biosynthesis